MHACTDWALARHPDLSARAFSREGREHAERETAFDQHSVSYDIDHPQALPTMRSALAGAANLFGCDEALESWVLGNEVNFYSTPSLHAARRYGDFLRSRYAGCVECVAEAWYADRHRWLGSDWTALARDHGLGAPMPDDEEEHPEWAYSADFLDSGAHRRWLDWQAFNCWRVTEWARALCASLKDVSRCHRCRSHPRRR